MKSNSGLSYHRSIYETLRQMEEGGGLPPEMERQIGPVNLNREQRNSLIILQGRLVHAGNPWAWNSPEQEWAHVIRWLLPEQQLRADPSGFRLLMRTTSTRTLRKLANQSPWLQLVPEEAVCLGTLEDSLGSFLRRRPEWFIQIRADAPTRPQKRREFLAVKIAMSLAGSGTPDLSAGIEYCHNCSRPALVHDFRDRKFTLPWCEECFSWDRDLWRVLTELSQAFTFPAPNLDGYFLCAWETGEQTLIARALKEGKLPRLMAGPSSTVVKVVKEA